MRLGSSLAFSGASLLALASFALASFVLASFVLASFVFPARARACPTCSVGDPTLTTMGAEAPYKNRVRLSLAASTRGDRLGRPQFDEIRLREQRFDLTAAWSATERLVLSFNLPLSHRHFAYADLSRENIVTLGDAELRARVILFRDRRFSPRHLLSMIAGLEMPTAPRIDRYGERLPLEVQPGTGSWDPTLGLGYDLFRNPYSLHIIATLKISTPGFEGSLAGPSGRLLATFQWQAHQRFGLRAGVDTRLDGITRESYGEVANSGGFIAFTALGFVASMTSKALLHAFVYIPTLNFLRGEHDEGVAASLGFTYDI